MAKIQIELMKAKPKQDSGLNHLLAILKELEYHTGFRYIEIDENTPPDPRKG